MNSENSSIRLRVAAGRRILSVLLAFLAACHSQIRKDIEPVHRDINAVLEDHQDELMAVPGVVGVCISLLEDQKTECIKVLLARKDRIVEKRIPAVLEGYRVVTEVTGEFRPMEPEKKRKAPGTH